MRSEFTCPSSGQKLPPETSGPISGSIFSTSEAEHLHPVVGRADLVVHARDQLGALRELVLAEREVKAAILLQGDVEPGLIVQFGGELGPAFGRPHGPAGVGRHAEALALHPDQREVCPRGALGDVALVEDDDASGRAGQAPGDGGAEQAAADDSDVVIL